MKPKISVVIPSYNSMKTLKNTLESLKKQTFKDFEVLIVDDCSRDESFALAKRYTGSNTKILRNKENKGPAVSRNVGIKNARGGIIALTDSDCILSKDWLENMHKRFKDKNINVIMGKVNIEKSTFLGDSISSLGYPAGGSVGFDRMWRVDKNGWTERASSCNMGVRKEIFLKYGLFDESFPFAGGEDAEFPYRLTENKVKIKYCPEVVIWHVPRKDLKSFIKWHFLRGKTNYYCKQKMRGVYTEFVSLKIWSSINIIKDRYKDPKIILIIPLLILTFILQPMGFIYETTKKLIQEG